MTRILPTQPEQQAITAVRKAIQLGPIQLDGFMLPDGHFRQGLRSTGRAIGQNHQRVSFVVSKLLAAGANALQGSESQAFPQAKSASNVEPVIRVLNRPESLLTLDLAQKFWAHEARHGDGESQDKAWELIDALVGTSLERSYQEAFGIQDSRSQADRLMDFFINWNIGKYRVLFDNEFRIQFKRVTSHDINSKSQHVKFIISNFLYNRLPAEVYEAMMELNPVEENGYRKLKHHQLLTDNARLEVVLPIISALKAFMVQAPAGDVSYVNQAMDQLHPAQRGQRRKTSLARHNQMAWC